VAEDVEQALSMLCAWLRKAGFEVAEARNGNQVLAQYRQQACDLVIMDLLMPE